MLSPVTPETLYQIAGKFTKPSATPTARLPGYDIRRVTFAESRLKCALRQIVVQSLFYLVKEGDAWKLSRIAPWWGHTGDAALDGMIDDNSPTKNKKANIADLVSAGKQAMASEEYDSAIASFQKALQLDPHNAEAQEGLN